MVHHLAILQTPYIAALLSGKKTIECRLSKTQRPPFHCVELGDALWIKETGGPIVAKADARRVMYFNPVTAETLVHIGDRYGTAIRAGDRFFRRNDDIRFATLILLGGVTRVAPFRIRKRDRRAWVVLAEPPRPGSPICVGETGRAC